MPSFSRSVRRFQRRDEYPAHTRHGDGGNRDRQSDKRLQAPHVATGCSAEGSGPGVTFASGSRDGACDAKCSHERPSACLALARGDGDPAVGAAVLGVDRQTSFRASAPVDTMRRCEKSAARPWHAALPHSFITPTGCADDNPPPRVSGPDVYLRSDTTEIRGVSPTAARWTPAARQRRCRRCRGGGHGRCARSIRSTKTEIVPAASARSENRRMGALRLFEYEIDGDSFLRVTRSLIRR